VRPSDAQKTADDVIGRIALLAVLAANYQPLRSRRPQKSGLPAVRRRKNSRHAGCSFPVLVENSENDEGNPTAGNSFNNIV
jgi:hypothetical protein